MELEAAKMIGAGLAAIALAGAGVGIGIIFGNYLSGAMRNPSAAQKQFPNLLLGFALAEAACDEGAFVSLISGPVNLPTPERIFRHDVETAKQMYDKVNEMIDEIDIFIATAAVCDIKPSHPSNQKIKKQQILDANNILLEENPDIVASVKKAHPNKKVIGFAAETENVLDNAKLKLSEKELDLIIANDVSNAEIGFDSDDNEVHLISEKNSRKINKSTKEKVSREIIKYISDNLK